METLRQWNDDTRLIGMWACRITYTMYIKGPATVIKGMLQMRL